MSPEEFQKYLASVSKKLQKGIDKDIPKVLGNEAIRLFTKNFRDEGFFGEKWKEVQRRQTKTVTRRDKKGKLITKTVTIGKGAAGSRKILTGAGNLARSIQMKVEPNQVVIYSDLKYSKAHNDGTDNAGRGKKTKIPQRQFIGEHQVLHKALKDKIEQNLNNIFK